MSTDIDLAAALSAWDAQRAKRITTHRHVAVRPDALVLCPIAMAGEDTTIHICAIGRVGGPPRILCAPDPRLRDAQFELLEVLHSIVGPWVAACREAGSYPQLWVQSAAAVSLLDTLAERMRYSRQNETVSALGELLTYFADRAPIDGQQALLAATTALTMHWQTPQQPSEDLHLGSVLAWIDGRPGALATVHEAELVPMGIHTDPIFDRDVLEPLVTRHNQLRREQAPAALLSSEAARIEAVLVTVARPIYDAAQRAISILSDSSLPELPSLDELEERERFAFSSFMASRDGGFGIRRLDSDKQAIHNLVEREDAIEQAKAAKVLEDGVERARARLSGDVLIGIVLAVGRDSDGHSTIEVRSQQRVLRIRPRDTLSWAGDSRLQFSVTNVIRDGDHATISMRLRAGHRCVGLPAVGGDLELVKTVPRWHWIGMEHGKIARRTRTTPWTHSRSRQTALSGSRQEPNDPLALVEALERTP